MQNLKIKSGHAFSQFELTKSLLNNLYKFELSANEKLVLLELSSFYNPKHADIFPKQKTIAAKLGCSERSVIRAIQSLVKTGLILVECKYTNRYKITQKLLNLCGIVKDFEQDENLSEKISKTVIKKADNLSVYNKEQTKEQKNNKLLLNYAKMKGAKNNVAYINALKKCGAANNIINELKQAETKAKVMYDQAQKTIKNFEKMKQECKNVKPTRAWKEIKQKLEANNG